MLDTPPSQNNCVLFCIFFQKFQKDDVSYDKREKSSDEAAEAIEKMAVTGGTLVKEFIWIVR